MIPRRNPDKATQSEYDLIVVGGGVYGAALAMESARRGLRPLLLERDDFGGATSWNSLRILHGGLRYLQSMDLHRFSESVTERRWFCRHFPQLVQPLECLMPLYGNGLKRPSIFRIALKMNDVLSRRRNDGVGPDKHLPDGCVLGVEQTKQKFPLVDATGLRGAGLWYDAAMINAPRMLIELIRWACVNGAAALNYVIATDLMLEDNRVAGVRAEDRIAGRPLEFRAPAVINCAGPWSRSVAAHFDRADETIFRPSLAFNVLLDRDPVSPCALAVTPRYQGARTYFMYPRGDQIFAGTSHAPLPDEAQNAAVSDELLDQFLADLNQAVPGFDVKRQHVLRTYAGLLPAKAAGTDEISVREVVKDHARSGGPRGLVTVSGVKFTTARLVAIKALQTAFRVDGRDLSVRSDASGHEVRSDLDFDDPASWLSGEADGPTIEAIRQLIETESAVTMDDLLLRRTDWGHDPRRLPALAQRVRELTGWGGVENVNDASHRDETIGVG